MLVHLMDLRSTAFVVMRIVWCLCLSPVVVLSSAFLVESRHAVLVCSALHGRVLLRLPVNSGVFCRDCVLMETLAFSVCSSVCEQFFVRIGKEVRRSGVALLFSC